MKSAFIITFLLAGSAAIAAPINYTVAFSYLGGLPGTPLPSATFTYDSGAGFSNFVVSWEGVNYDITAAANQPIGASTPPSCSSSTFATSFLALEQQCTQEIWIGNGDSFSFTAADGPSIDSPCIANSLAPGGFVYGGFSIAAVPEPSTCTVVTLALGILVLCGMPARSPSRHTFASRR